MRLTAQDIIDCLEQWAPVSLQEKWDNAGLCLGVPSAPVEKVLLCLDCTEEVVREAVKENAQMIVSHHPLIFTGLKHLCDSTPVERAVALAVRHQLVVYCAHTNADKVMDGVSGAMACALGLQDLEVLENNGESHLGNPCGLGLVGNLPQPVTTPLFQEQVKRAFSLEGFRGSHPFHSMISRVALCGGSGSSLIEAAVQSGAQVYISGDFSYHHYFDVINRTMLWDIGHYESEVGVLKYFANVLQKKFPIFAVQMTEQLTNPIRFYQ